MGWSKEIYDLGFRGFGLIVNMGWSKEIDGLEFRGFGLYGLWGLRKN